MFEDLFPINNDRGRVQFDKWRKETEPRIQTAFKNTVRAYFAEVEGLIREAEEASDELGKRDDKTEMLASLRSVGQSLQKCFDDARKLDTELKNDPALQV